MFQSRFPFDRDREDRDEWQLRLRRRLRVHEQRGPLTDEQAGHLCGERVAGAPYHTASVWLRANGYLAHVNQYARSSVVGRQQCSVLTDDGRRALGLPRGVPIPAKKS